MGRFHEMWDAVIHKRKTYHLQRGEVLFTPTTYQSTTDAATAEKHPKAMLGKYPLHFVPDSVQRNTNDRIKRV